MFKFFNFSTLFSVFMVLFCLCITATFQLILSDSILVSVSVGISCKIFMSSKVDEYIIVQCFVLWVNTVLAIFIVFIVNFDSTLYEGRVLQSFHETKLYSFVNQANIQAAVGYLILSYSLQLLPLISPPVKKCKGNTLDCHCEQCKPTHR